jgi:ABC-type oligopeptide transport system ATPase subunit
MSLVEVDAVSKSYPSRTSLRTEEHTVVGNVSLSIKSSETVGLVGEPAQAKLPSPA